MQLICVLHNIFPFHYLALDCNGLLIKIADRSYAGVNVYEVGHSVTIIDVLYMWLYTSSRVQLTVPLDLRRLKVCIFKHTDEMHTSGSFGI